MKAVLVVALVLVAHFEGVFGEERHYVFVKEDTSPFDKRSNLGSLPDEFSVSFKTKDDHVTLNLRRNLDINHNAPVTFTDGSSVEKRSELKNVGVYQDFDKRASISVTAHSTNGEHVRSLEGSFVHNGKYYLIEPTEGAIGKLLMSLQKRGFGHTEAVPHILTEKKMYIPRSAAVLGSIPQPPIGTQEQIDYQLRAKAKNGPKIIEVNVPKYKDENRRGQDTEGALNDEIASRLLALLRANRGRSRVRRATIVLRYRVELLLVLDHTIWERNMELAKNDPDEATKKLKYYFSHIVNGIDLAYSSIDPIKHGFTVDVFLKGYLIAKTKPESIWTAPFLMGTPSGNNYREIGVNGSLVLDYMAEWHVSGGRTWYNPDHAMLFTRYNIDKSGTIGLAPLGAVCTASGNSIVEDIGFHAWYTAAHELGHNLGAGHDGDDNSCNGLNQHIMAPTAGTVASENVKNVYTFSECSIKEMKENIKGTGSDDSLQMPRVCLHNKVCTHVDFTPDISTLPGQRHDATQQCQARFGLSSTTCDGWDDNICLTLGCKNHNDRCAYWSPGAADGTPCGTDKWCYQAKCVDKTTIQLGAADASCKKTSLAIAPPTGCADTSGFKIKVNQLDGTSTDETCSSLADKNPEFCFTNDLIAQHCCVSCHKLGLVKGALPEETLTTTTKSATVTTAATNEATTTTTQFTTTTQPRTTTTTTTPQTTTTTTTTTPKPTTTTTTTTPQPTTTTTTTTPQPTTTTTTTTPKPTTTTTTTTPKPTTTTTTIEVTTTTMNTAETVTPGEGQGCVDISDPEYCANWKIDGDCTKRKWRAWMAKNCKKTCGKCQGETTTTTTTTTTPLPTTSSEQECVDQYDKEDCEYWKGLGDCRKRKWRKWMKKHCKKTCGKCPEKTATNTPQPTTSSKPACSDSSKHQKNCKSWKSAGYCKGYYGEWMAKNCKKTCGHCQQNGACVDDASFKVNIDDEWLTCSGISSQYKDLLPHLCNMVSILKTKCCASCKQ